MDYYTGLFVVRVSTTGISVILTPKQLVLETLAKMSVFEANLDCIMYSPDKSRLTKAYEYFN